jgi:type I restriction enzyme S subunit
MAISPETVKSLRREWTPDIPSAWTFTAFGDVLRQVSRPVQLDDEEEYVQPVIRRRHGGIDIRERQLGKDILTKAQYRLEAGDWLMSKVQILHGAYGIVPPDLDGSVASGSYFAFQPTKNLDLNYLWYLSQHRAFHRTCEAASVGVVIEKMMFRVKDWLRTEAPLPPLPEQKKIAEILGSVDEAIRATEAVIEQTRRVKEGLLQELLTKGIGHTKFKQTEIGEIPEGWEVRTVGETATRVTVGHVGPTSDHYCEGGVPFLRTGNVRRMSINALDVATITPEFDATLRKSKLCEGDVLIARVGANRGMAAVVTPKFDGANCANIVVVRPSDALLGTYLAWLVNSPFGQTALLGVSAGSAQGVINTSAVHKWKIPLPPPTEQMELTRLLGVSLENEERQEQLCASLTTLKEGLLQDLLTGKVRVKP